MEELQVRPSGRVLVKPNVVLAHPQVFPHTFTRKEFLEGSIIAVKTRAAGMTELAVGERSGITIPTRYCFKNAGYLPVLKRHKIKTYYFDEVKQVPVRLDHKDRLRDSVFVPEPITNCDFLINLPKFKAHPWTRLTLSFKNFIGIQDDRHRLIDHNLFLEQKIADLHHVIQPKFIAIDGITAGQKMMLTPTPFNLGAIVMGVNSCAVDTVGCHMVHVDPCNIKHLKLAADSGLGPINLEEINITGDYPLDEIQEKTQDFEFCVERIDEYFSSNANLKCTVGTFPEKHSHDYCWGGCPGALQEAMHISAAFHPGILSSMKPIRYVVGKVERPLKARKYERIIFAGACTSWKGVLDGERVSIKSSYDAIRKRDAGKTKTNDLVVKTAHTLWDCMRNRSSKYVHVRDCPVSVADHVNYTSFLGRFRNPNFMPEIFFPVMIAYVQMRFHRAMNELRSMMHTMMFRK